MKEQKKKKYEAPETKKTQVELEAGICAASTTIRNPDNEEQGKIKSHEVNSDFGYTFENSDWD